VIVLEASRPPIDKACGEGLLPGTLTALRHLGVRLPSYSGHPFRGIRFIRNSICATADFSAGYGLGLRRTDLQRALIERAIELEIDLRWNVKKANEFTGGKLIIGADGQNSAIRRRGFEEIEVRKRYGFRRHFATPPWSNYVEVYWGNGRQIYVTPVSPREVGVALLSDHAHERLADVLPQFPMLSQRLATAAPTRVEKGALTVMRRLRRVSRENLILLGDASGSVDAITGEGIGLALEQAIALGAAFRANNLAQYERAHRRILRRPRVMARALLCLARHPALQSAAISLFARYPALFRKLLAFHVGQTLPASRSCTCSPLEIG
jgi:2-polyprenyl-6-methoxyphenol hydroxylase-like FAD-dependent oxidoreductase